MAKRDVIIGGIVTEMRSLSTRDGRSFLAAEVEDMTGSLEVTVWPETWEQTRALWQAGNVVIMNVRVKAGRASPGLRAEGRSLYRRDSIWLVVANGGGNGNGYRRNGNGNGNGGPRSTPPASASGPSSSTEPSGLRIILDETDDEDGDHERLRLLVNAIGDYAGDAEVRLSIRQRDGEEVEMALPPPLLP
jgi:DNA polymerase-3 subunit alpha